MSSSAYTIQAFEDIFILSKVALPLDFLNSGRKRIVRVAENSTATIINK